MRKGTGSEYRIDCGPGFVRELRRGKLWTVENQPAADEYRRGEEERQREIGMNYG